MPIQIELPDDCEGDLVLLVRTKANASVEDMPGWTFLGDQAFPAAATGFAPVEKASVTRLTYYRLVKK